MALIGWLDWLLAAAVFVACLEATGHTAPILEIVDGFFLGQVVGLVSLVPGGFGSSDAYWIARLPFNQNVTAAALGAYRSIYYVAPWFTASLVLLSWATRISSRRIDVARRITASLVGASGVLMILSSASPALHARLVLMEQHVPLPLVEVGQLAAALAGLLLLVLARGLARGYRSAFTLTLALLLLAGFASLLKGLDWEEAVIIGTIGIAAWSQSALFDRASGGDWLEWADLGLGFAALLLFVIFGTFSHHIGPTVFERWTSIGYRLQSARFLRSAASMFLAVSAGALYILIRTPVRFEPPGEDDIGLALDSHAAYGTGTTPMMIAVRDKSVFFDGVSGFCLYRTIGPYLTVLSDPTARSIAGRGAFMEALFAFAANLDRRPLFYQISVDWIPLLHDRGYHLFKLGEEAHVHLDRITLEGHAGKMARQILRRAERDGLTFRIMQPPEIDAHMAELADISSGWLRAKHVIERQFSLGYFDPAYLRRFPCAIVETRENNRLVAFCCYPSCGTAKTRVIEHSTSAWRRSRPLASTAARDSERSSPGFSSGAARTGTTSRGCAFINRSSIRNGCRVTWRTRARSSGPVALAHVSALIAGSWGSALLPRRDPSRQDPDVRLVTVGRA